MAHPQVADGGTTSNMVGSCEYKEYAVADNGQGLVLQIWCLGVVLKSGFSTKHEHMPHYHRLRYQIIR